MNVFLLLIACVVVVVVVRLLSLSCVFGVAVPELASVRPGDVLIGVNHHHVGFSGVAEVSRLIQMSGAEVRLVFARHPFVDVAQPGDRVRLQKVWVCMCVLTE